MRPVLSLKLLGGFELFDGAGAQIVLRRKKAIALLAYLAIRDGRPQYRQVIAGFLWGDSDDRRARVSLRQTLAILKRALAPRANEALDIGEELIRLRPELISLDVAEVRSLAKSNPTCASQRLNTLYDGPLLGDFVTNEDGFDRWLAAERARIEQAVVTLLRNDLQTRIGFADTEAAVQIARQLLSIDPTLEDVHRELMRLYAARGQHDRAMRQYHACRTALHIELDVAPDPDTQRLHRALRSSYGAFPVIHGPGEMPPPDLAVQQFATPDDTKQASMLRLEIVRCLAGWNTFATRETGAVADFRLAGILQRVGDRQWAVVRLIDEIRDRILWAERFDHGDLGSHDAFEVLARRIAAAVACEIEIRIPKLAFRVNSEPPAWRLYRQAVGERLIRNEPSTLKARSLFRQALENEPRFARALSGFAGATIFATSQGWLKGRRVYIGEALAAAQLAVSLEPRDAAIGVTHACALLHACNHDGALAESLRSLELNPCNPMAHAHYGVTLQTTGYSERAVESLETASILAPRNDPQASPIRTWYARALTGAGCFAEAAKEAATQVRRLPDHGESYLALASSLLHCGDRLGAREVASACERNIPGFVLHRLRYRECRTEKDELHLTAGFRSA